MEKTPSEILGVWQLLTRFIHGVDHEGFICDSG